jgi:hypothetical protein
MAKVDVKTEVQAPDEIRINLVREDFLDTSNIFRIFFEIALAIAGTILGSVISILSNNSKVLFIIWFFLFLMIIACIAFLVLSIRHYNLAKCQTAK